MEKKLSGILLSADCFLLTRMGLATISEISPGDSLVGIDLSGKISTYTIREKPILFGPKILVNLITDHTATIIPGDCEVYTAEKGISRVDKLHTGDHVEILGRKAATSVISLMDNTPVPNAEFEITEDLSYLFGRGIIRKTRNKVYFKACSHEEVEKIVSLLRASATRQFGGKIYRFRENEVCYVSENFFAHASTIDLDSGKIPKFVRMNGLSILKGFFQGIIDRSVGPANIAQVSLALTASRTLQFIKDLALLFGNNIMFQRHYISKGIITTSVGIGRFPTSKVTRTSFGEVLTRFNIFGPAFLLVTDGGWEPIIDNLLIHRHTLSYISNDSTAANTRRTLSDQN